MNAIDSGGDDAATALIQRLRLADYKDTNNWAPSGWTYMLHRKSFETRPINSIWLSVPSPRQVLWVVFDSYTCLSLEAMGERVG